MSHADPHRIHELKYELGFRDDPPPARLTDKPGAVLPYNPLRPAAIRSSGAHGLWQIPPRRAMKPETSEALTKLYMAYARKHGKE